VRCYPAEMKALAIGVLALLLLCCQHSAMPDEGSRDEPRPPAEVEVAAPPKEVAAPPKESGPAECAPILKRVSELVDTSQTCDVDADCASLTTQCGLPGVCPVAVRTSVVAEVKQLTEKWTAADCWKHSGVPCPGCTPQGAPQCRDKVCVLLPAAS
jgi:hypothetical protein